MNDDEVWITHRLLFPKFEVEVVLRLNDGRECTGHYSYTTNAWCGNDNEYAHEEIEAWRFK